MGGMPPSYRLKRRTSKSIVNASHANLVYMMSSDKVDYL